MQTRIVSRSAKAIYKDLETQLKTTGQSFDKLRASRTARAIVGTLADALAVNEDEVIPKALLAKNLGAESIDYLDIEFKLEQALPELRRILDIANQRTIVPVEWNPETGRQRYSKSQLTSIKDKFKGIYDNLHLDKKTKFDKTRESGYFIEGLTVRGLARHVYDELGKHL